MAKRYLKVELHKITVQDVYVEVDDEDPRASSWFKDGELLDEVVCPLSRLEQDIGRQCWDNEAPADEFGFDVEGAQEVSGPPDNVPLFSLSAVPDDDFPDINGTSPVLTRLYAQFMKGKSTLTIFNGED